MEPPSPAVPVAQSVSQLSKTSSSSIPASYSTSKTGTVTMGVSPALLYQVPPGLPATPGPPGSSPSIPLPANMTITPPSVDSSTFPRPAMQAAPTLPSNPVQQQGYSPYPSLSPMVAPLQAPWLPPTQVSGMLRPPFAAYPPAFTSPFPLPARGMPLPSVPMSDIQPPGITSARVPLGSTPIASSSQLTSGIGVKPELPPGIGNTQSLC